MPGIQGKGALFFLSYRHSKTGERIDGGKVLLIEGEGETLRELRQAPPAGALYRRLQGPVDPDTPVRSHDLDLSAKPRYADINPGRECLVQDVFARRAYWLLQQLGHVKLHRFLFIQPYTG
jgi:hypothetical protein